MNESYPAMQERHDELDAQLGRQERLDRWAGPSEYYEIEPEEPAVIRDCTNCRHAINSQAPYWCSAYSKMTYGDGVTDCSGWSWDPVDEAAA